MALTGLRCSERTKTFVSKKEHEEKTKRAALRAVKTHLARDLYRTLEASHVGRFPNHLKNQLELLSLVVLALLQAKDVRHVKFAEGFPGSPQIPSVIRRIERFFNHHPLCLAELAAALLKPLLDNRKREFIIDRTN
ncbi:hypothetical protein ACFFLM_12005 [Deinococcus oregonensis]|uniref:Transposase n=1 Tax=Deinococcus oregonensis TaxID=1805970 RepID=A0ABV6B0A7_9DEIO